MEAINLVSRKRAKALVGDTSILDKIYTLRKAHPTAKLKVSIGIDSLDANELLDYKKEREEWAHKNQVSLFDDSSWQVDTDIRDVRWDAKNNLIIILVHLNDGISMENGCCETEEWIAEDDTITHGFERSYHFCIY
jgi:hypothetical protein